MLLRMRYVSLSLSVFCAAASCLYSNPPTGLLVTRDLPGSDNLTAKMNKTSSTANTQEKASIFLPSTNSNQTQSNTTCTLITEEEEISPNHLYNLNIPSKAHIQNSTSSPSATMGTLAGQAAPSPTQPGISPSCNKYSQAHEGIQCAQFANMSGITADNLYNWNTVLGPTGDRCETHFLTSYYYCVGITSNITLAAVKIVTNGSVSAAPTPTQNGISPSCTEYSQAPPGDTCATLNIAMDSGISKQQFYTWNDVLGPKGQTCNAGYWAKYWYCVGINPALGGRVSSSSTSNPNPSTMLIPTRRALSSTLVHRRSTDGY